MVSRASGGWGALGAGAVYIGVALLLSVGALGLSSALHSPAAGMFVALAASEELSRALVCRAWKLRQRHHWILAALPVVAFEYIPIVLKSDWSYLLGTLAGFGLKSAMSLIHIAAFVLIGYAMTRRRFGWIVAAIIYCSLSHALNNWFGARLAQMSAAEWLIFVTNIVLIVAVATIAWRTAGALTRAEAAAG